MQQVLFHLPFTEGWFGMPDGIPLHGFGAMLCVCFLLTAMLMCWRIKGAILLGMLFMARVRAGRRDRR